MTPAQLQTLKAAILADATAAALAGANNHIGLAAYLNSPGTGQIYRPSISSVELNTAIVWTEYALLTALAQNAYLAMLYQASGRASQVEGQLRTALLRDPDFYPAQ